MLITTCLSSDTRMLQILDVLHQNQEGLDRVIAYARKSMKSAEKNYPTHKLEFLALKWAVTEKFHDYLYGTKFEAVTDNDPLTYILTSAKLDATWQRWVAALSSYNFDLTHRSEMKNADGDGLSRLPRPDNMEINTDNSRTNSDNVTMDSVGIKTDRDRPRTDTDNNRTGRDRTKTDTDDMRTD